MTSKSRLQHSEIPLRAFEDGFVTIEPAANRQIVQLQFMTRTVARKRLELYDLSPEEAYVIGSSMIEHAQECGFDYDTGETRPEEKNQTARDLVQLQHPKTKRYVLIDRSEGQILGRRPSKVPYRGVPFAVKRKRI